MPRRSISSQQDASPAQAQSYDQAQLTDEPGTAEATDTSQSGSAASDLTGEEPGVAGRLRRFIGGLPHTERLVFLLRHADELSAIDIGRVTDLPVHVVSRILTRIDREARAVIDETPQTLVT